MADNFKNACNMYYEGIGIDDILHENIIYTNELFLIRNMWVYHIVSYFNFGCSLLAIAVE